MLSAKNLIAHRGFQQAYPENSLLAMEQALALGAKHIECDVLLSGDGVFFLCHDRDLKRLSGKRKLLPELAAEDILKLPSHEPSRLGDTHKGTTFSPLTDLITLIKKHPDVMFYIELKRGALISHGQKYCLATLENLLAGLMNITLMSFDRLSMRAARKMDFSHIGVVLEHWNNKDEVIDYCSADVAFINKNHVKDKTIMAKCPIALYEIDDIAEAEQWLERGASFIETFNIKKLLGQ